MKKSKEEATPLDWKSPAMMLSFMVLVFAMRLGEEGFEFKARNPRRFDSIDAIISIWRRSIRIQRRD